MARRLFSTQIVDSDAFLDMPASAQNLYFHLGMRADDDGFVGNPKKIGRVCGANDDDLKVLIGKRFLLAFESGVVVIKHWLIHNLIRADLYHETQYKKEKETLGLNQNGAYTELRDGVDEIKQIEAPEWLKRRRKEHERTESVPNSVCKDKIREDKLSKDKLSKEIVAVATPQTESKEFFNSEEKQTEVINALQEQFGKNDLIPLEVKKFVDYWTEPNKSGTRQKWEQETTFEVSRRLKRWFNNIKQFQGQSNSPKLIKIK